MFKLSTYPAGEGDCLLLSYGDAPPYRNVMIDGGRKFGYRALRPTLLHRATLGERLDLLVLTHIDADHIEGLLDFAAEVPPPIDVAEVWYNGFEQMSCLEALGERQGDDFSIALKTRGWPWNSPWSGQPVMVGVKPSPFDFAGLKVTLLSPDREKLSAMRARWAFWRTAEARKLATSEAAVIDRGRHGEPGSHLESLGPRAMPAALDVPALAVPTRIDSEEPNGSSIAILAEWNGRRLLLTGDAHPDLLVKTIGPLAHAEGGRLAIDLLKVSHHGSAGNTTAELLALLDCQNYLITTDGSRHGHPNPQAIARILMGPAERTRTLYFNTATAWTRPWNARDLRDQFNYTCVYGDPKGRLDIDI